MASIPSECDVGAGNENASPGRYLLKFESFSSLSAYGIYKYESSVFESSGYKWKMIIYPDGDESVDGRDHISVYLAIAETSSLQAGWEVNATISFLIFDQIHDKYFVMRGMTQHFHNIKIECGFSECISHETFREPSNGYLINDKCVFGVDVSVIKNQGFGERVSLFNEFNSYYKHEWMISEFSKLENTVRSEEFTVGDYKWKLCLYPTGDGSQNGQSISIFLESVDAKGFDFRKRVLAIFCITVKDQISGAHSKSIDYLDWFSAAVDNWGWSAFMPLHVFNNSNKGYLVEDCCIVEAHVSVIGEVNGLA